MRTATTLALTLALALSAGSAFAKPVQCRDAKGKFIKCPAPAAQHCRDIKTKKFAKCGLPGTEVVPGKH